MPASSVYRIPRGSAVREVFRRYGKKTMILGVQMRPMTMSLCRYLDEFSDVSKPRDLGMVITGSVAMVRLWLALCVHKLRGIV